MRNLSELAINQGGGALRLPPTDALFSSLESASGLKIPTALRLLLCTVNGGHPALDAVGGSDGQYAINRFYHLTSDDHGPESMWYALKHWRSVLGMHALPFASDGGGNQFFLDFSMEPPAVKLCIHDESMRTVFIAPSFEAFIDSLDSDPDMI